MIEWIMVFAVLLPIFGCALFPFLPIKNRSAMRIYLETVAGVTSLMAFYLIWKQPAGSFVLFRFTNCQNGKCRQKTQNRVSGGTSFGVYGGENSSFSVKA